MYCKALFYIIFNSKINGVQGANGLTAQSKYSIIFIYYLNKDRNFLNTSVIFEKNTLMKFLFPIALFCVQLSFGYTALDWGKTGHRTVGHIAEAHLTKKAQKAIYKLLEGTSLAFVSTYGDDIKSDSRYRDYNPWHYVNLPLEGTYNPQKANPKGDLILAIKTCVAVLENPNSQKAHKIFHLKLLVHFIGDLHQPMHIGRAADKGGNDIKLTWFGKNTNLHRVWDSNLVAEFGMSYTELAAAVPPLSKREKKQLAQGTPLDWLQEGHKITATLYKDLPKNGKLGYAYAYKYTTLMRGQLQKGGLRLAKMLNTIFG